MARDALTRRNCPPVEELLEFLKEHREGKDGLDPSVPPSDYTFQIWQQAKRLDTIIPTWRTYQITIQPEQAGFTWAATSTAWTMTTGATTEQRNATSNGVITWAQDALQRELRRE